jgi:hypothetical protein
MLPINLAYCLVSQSSVELWNFLNSLLKSIALSKGKEEESKTTKPLFPKGI